MNITQANTVHYLLERGLLTRESAVDGDLVLVSSSSNNSNTKVIRKDNPGFFIKQIRRSDMTAVVSVQREAMAYWLGYNDADFASLIPYIPKYHDYDPTRHLLVTELLADGVNLYEYRFSKGAYPPGVAAQMGTALAAYHKSAGAEMRKGEKADTMAKTIPWVLTLHDPQSPMVPTFGAASAAMLNFLRSDPAFTFTLDTLQKLWRYDSFIHGDIKWDNFIIYEQSESGDKFTLKIIDWELAGFGDAAWDAGSAFQAYIGFPILSMTSVPGPLPSDLVGLLQYAPREIRDSIREFWIGYITARPMEGTEAGEFIDRTMRDTGARLLQTAFECTETLKNQPQQHQYYTDMLTAKAYCLARVALDIMKNPAVALAQIFNA
jgi:hypothetical protein